MKKFLCLGVAFFSLTSLGQAQEEFLEEELFPIEDLNLGEENPEEEVFPEEAPEEDDFQEDFPEEDFPEEIYQEEILDGFSFEDLFPEEPVFEEVFSEELEEALSEEGLTTEASSEDAEEKEEEEDEGEVGPCGKVAKTEAIDTSLKSQAPSPRFRRYRNTSARTVTAAPVSTPEKLSTRKAFPTVWRCAASSYTEGILKRHLEWKELSREKENPAGSYEGEKLIQAWYEQKAKEREERIAREKARYGAKEDYWESREAYFKSIADEVAAKKEAQRKLWTEAIKAAKEKAEAEEKAQTEAKIKSEEERKAARTFPLAITNKSQKSRWRIEKASASPSPSRARGMYFGGGK